MAVTEIQSLDDARTRVNTLFVANKPFRLQAPDEIEDYAKIAHFLTQTNSLVVPALEEVSKQIWIRYNLEELKQSPNRFSRAIIKYGADVFGFAIQDNVVFIGPLEGPEFLSYVRSGVLWKDTFAPSHGEFAHSLQWFAAGQGLNLGTRTALSLQKSGRSVQQFRHGCDPGRQRHTLVRARQPLWAWLVDCFRPGSLESQILDTDIAHVFSKKCRVPNQVNQIALDKKSWFLHLYIDHRKRWLEKIAVVGKAMRVTDAEEQKKLEPGYTLPEPDSNLLGIVKYQGKAYPQNSNWTPETNQISSPSGRDIPRSGLALKKTASSNTTKTQVPKTFHGIEGTVSIKAIDSKSLIS